ncbi:MAG: hypothetical protein AAB706_03530 [Patescibacteria group bacterium]
MTNDKVSLHDVYEITGRIEEKLDKMEIRVSAIEIWKAQFIGQLTIIVGMVNLAIAVSFDWIKKQVFQDKI